MANEKDAKVHRVEETHRLLALIFVLEVLVCNNESLKILCLMQYLMMDTENVIK